MTAYDPFEGLFNDVLQERHPARVFSGLARSRGKKRAPDSLLVGLPRKVAILDMRNYRYRYFLFFFRYSRLFNLRF